VRQQFPTQGLHQASSQAGGTEAFVSAHSHAFRTVPRVRGRALYLRALRALAGTGQVDIAVSDDVIGRGRPDHAALAALGVGRLT